MPQPGLQGGRELGERDREALAFVEAAPHALEDVAHRGVALLFGERVDRLDERQPGVEQRHELVRERHDREPRAAEAAQPRRLDREHPQTTRHGLAARVHLVDRVEVVVGDGAPGVEDCEAIAHGLPVRDVGVFAGAAGPAVAAVRQEVKVAVVAGLRV